jgi:hypothetical protein
MALDGDDEHHPFTEWVDRSLCPLVTSDGAERMLRHLPHYDVHDHIDFDLNDVRNHVPVAVGGPDALNGAYIGALSAAGKGHIQFHQEASPIASVDLVRALSARNYRFSIISCDKTLNQQMAKQIETACREVNPNLFMWKTKDGDFDVLTECDVRLIDALFRGQPLYDIAKSLNCPRGYGMWTFGPAFSK